MYYFASDMHLGLGSREDSLRREKLLVEWFNRVSADARAIFLVGDVFDFWYEYKRVVPKGFTRLLGTLSSLTDQGVEIHFFPGNHDMWAYDYLNTECGVIVHHEHAIMELHGKRCYIAHGDDIHAAAGGFWVRFMNSGFRSRAMRWLFSHLLHPNTALRLGQKWSTHSRKSKAIAAEFYGEKDYMVSFARRYIENSGMDYFFFGHNHCAEVYPLNDSSTAVFLGEWINNPTYATLDPAGKVSLNKFP